MALMDKIFGEFVDVIQWTDDSQDTMVWRFERHGNEIKYGAKLTVREGQTAVFVNEGEIADIFTPGMYELFDRATCRSSPRCRPGRTASRARSRPRSISSARAVHRPEMGHQEPGDRCATPSSARCGCAPSAPTRSGSRTRPCSCARSSAPTATSPSTRSATSCATSSSPASARSSRGSGIPVLDLAANYDQLGKFVTGRIAPEFANYGLELDHDPGRERLAAARGRAGARPAHLDGRGRRPVEVRPVPGGRGDARGRRATRAARRRRDRHGHGHGRWPADGEAIAGQAAGAAAPPPIPQERSLPRRASTASRPGRSRSSSCGAGPGGRADRARAWSGPRAWAAGSRPARSPSSPPCSPRCRRRFPGAA